MPLAIPRLDDLTWEDLSQEGRSLIPAFAPGWTNHNASDPGITLVELFAYYCEIFLYRLDRVGEANVRAFLKLINGPGWRPGHSLGDDIRATLLDLRRPHRAVTPEDFEFLALAVNEQPGIHAAEEVGRVRCLPRRNLEAGGAPASTTDAPGHVSVVIVPKPLDAPIAPLLRRVRDAIEPARLLATRLHVVPARFLSVGVRLSLTAERHAAISEVRSAALHALRQFLDPLEGGSDNKGWPFGRSVYVSEICQLLVNLPGVRAVQKTLHPETGKPMEEFFVRPGDAARLRYNRLRELEAVELQPDELVGATLEEGDITITSGGNPSAARQGEVIQ